MNHFLAVVETKLTFLYIFVVECRLFLGTFLSTSVTADPHARPVDLGWLPVAKLKMIYFLRYLFRRQRLFEAAMEKTLDTIVQNMQRRPYDASQYELSIPTFTLDDISAEEFYQQFVRNGRPAVFKNVNSEAVEKWNAEYFMQEYASKKLIVQNRAGVDQSQTVEDYLKDSSNTYAQNTVDILKECPELVEQLELNLSFARTILTSSKNIINQIVTRYLVYVQIKNFKTLLKSCYKYVYVLPL